MSLTLKDLAATILAAITAEILYIQAKGLEIPVLSSNRLATLALLIAGGVMCSVGYGSDIRSFSRSGPLPTATTVLGIMALLVGILGLITGNQIMVISLAVIILAMWLLTTARHALTRQQVKASQ